MSMNDSILKLKREIEDAHLVIALKEDPTYGLVISAALRNDRDGPRLLSPKSLEECPRTIKGITTIEVFDVQGEHSYCPHDRRCWTWC
jgi:hypothetical protein